MRIRIRDRSHLHSLVEYLERCDCTLSFREAFHPGAGVELIH